MTPPSAADVVQAVNRGWEEIRVANDAGSWSVKIDSRPAKPLTRRALDELQGTLDGAIAAVEGRLLAEITAINPHAVTLTRRNGVAISQVEARYVEAWHELIAADDGHVVSESLRTQGIGATASFTGKAPGAMVKAHAAGADRGTARGLRSDGGRWSHQPESAPFRSRPSLLGSGSPPPGPMAAILAAFRISSRGR